MKWLAALAITAALISTGAHADTTAMTAMTAVPSHSATVSNWYNQNVYDPSDKKIGDVKDVLLTQDGTVAALIISVGGFLGIGEKDVAVPFSSVKQVMKDGKSYLTLDTTKEALNTAPGFKYDRTSRQWMPV